MAPQSIEVLHKELEQLVEERFLVPMTYTKWVFLEALVPKKRHTLGYMC